MYKEIKKLQAEINYLASEFQLQEQRYKEYYAVYEQKKNESSSCQNRLWFNSRIQLINWVLGALLFLFGGMMFAITSITPIKIIGFMGCTALCTLLIHVVCKYYEKKDKARSQQVFSEMEILLKKALATNTEKIFIQLDAKQNLYKEQRTTMQAVLKKHARDISIDAVPHEDLQLVDFVLQLCGRDTYLNKVIPIHDLGNKEKEITLIKPSQLN